MASKTPKHKLGPGKPPKDTRFKPGQSGNPNGRPKGSKNFATILQKELRKKVTLTIDGKTKRLTAQEVIARRLTTDGMKGVSKAIDLIIKLTQAAEQEDQAGNVEQAVMPDKDTLRRIHQRLGKLVEKEK